MKAVILAGGYGTRLTEETTSRPKPMVEVGGYPVLWHIMKIYSAHGINEFVVCLGYKGYVIKEYFANYCLHHADVTFDMQRNAMELHQNKTEPWRVTLVDTGERSQTGGRLRRVKDYIGDDSFCFTYGDGVADIDIARLIQFHNSHGRQATVTAVLPPGRFGSFQLEGELASSFQEKPAGNGNWINGGFFVLEPSVIDLIADDDTIWEQTPMQSLVARKELAVFKHYGFWRPMDTLRDKLHLEELWKKGEAPWKIW
ncbi:MAG: glucose-1-phosphate cytidylyltransferase [Gammaproteobacteria bacterium]